MKSGWAGGALVRSLSACVAGWLVVAQLCGCLSTCPRVVTYPAPDGEAVTGDYAVSVNGKPVAVYAAKSEFFDGDYAFASFDFSGQATVHVTSALPLDNVRVLPERFGIKIEHNGPREITLSVREPFRVSIERKGRIKPLLLFGNAPDENVPRPSDPNVVYFGPGVHRTGRIALTDNQTLYVAGGAVVKGCVWAKGTNITIRGRGIIGGEESPRFKGPGRYLLDCQECRDLTVRDVTLRNAWGWTFVTWACEDVAVDNVKICGSRMLNDDALDLVNTRNATVRNCFFRTQDDCIAVKGLAKMTQPCENIVVENCQFWTDLANIFRIGYECETSAMNNIRARDIDVLHYSKDVRPPTEYWANAIIWLQPNQNLAMRDCHFENVRVYSDGEDVLMLMAKPMRCAYGEFTNPEPGSLKDCSFKNIRVEGARGKFTGLIYLRGDGPEHAVNGMRFEDVSYFDRPVTRDSPCVQIGPHADGVVFHGGK